MATIDVDIVPARPKPNLANLAAALADLEAKIRAAGTEALPFSASAESLQGMNVLNLTTRFGDLDLTFAPSGFVDGFDVLRRGATAMTIDGVRVLVASLDDVIASKEAAPGATRISRHSPGSSGCSRNNKTTPPVIGCLGRKSSDQHGWMMWTSSSGRTSRSHTCVLRHRGRRPTGAGFANDCAGPGCRPGQAPTADSAPSSSG